MKRSKMVSVIAIILAVLMLFSLVASIIPVLFAASDAEIQELKAQRDALVIQMSEQQAVIDELEAQHADVVERKLAMDERNEYLKQQIDLLKQEISTYETMIEEKAAEVEEAKAKETEQLEKYRSRVRAMEERGGYNFLAIIFNSDNLGELLTAVDDMREIMEADKALEDEYIAAREHSEQVEAEYEEYKAQLEEDKETLDKEVAELEVQIDEATALIADILNDINAESEELALITASERAAETQIANMIIELEAQKRAAEEAARQAAAAEWERQQAAANSGSGESYAGESGGEYTENNSSGGYVEPEHDHDHNVTGSGSYTWPTSNTYITSAVGDRYHPISGEWKYHAGMDIGASYGDSVWAADTGTVVTAGVNGGYGNCVVIDHGNGYYTLYGHLSEINVNENQEISQGQVIGSVGSTGVATGPHLHFEIREGGSPVDFNDWFGGLTYDPDSGG